MLINSIEWIDKEIGEAEVLISDKDFCIKCFSQPFDKDIGTSLIDPIYCMNVENIKISYETISHVEKKENYFAYSICAKLIDKTNKIALLGSIQLCLEDSFLPADIQEGNFIEFDVSRLDIY